MLATRLTDAVTTRQDRSRRSGEQHAGGDPEGRRAAVRRTRCLRRVEPAGQRGRGAGQQRRSRLPLRHQDRSGAGDRAETPRVDRATARADGGRYRRVGTSCGTGSRAWCGHSPSIWPSSATPPGTRASPPRRWRTPRTRRSWSRMRSRRRRCVAVGQGITRCLPDLPMAVVTERNIMVRNLMMHTCADFERAFAEGAGHAPDHAGRRSHPASSTRSSGCGRRPVTERPLT